MITWLLNRTRLVKQLQWALEETNGTLEVVLDERDTAIYERDAMASCAPLAVCLTCGSAVDVQRRDGITS